MTIRFDSDCECEAECELDCDTRTPENPLLYEPNPDNPSFIITLPQQNTLLSCKFGLWAAMWGDVGSMGRHGVPHGVFPLSLTHSLNIRLQLVPDRERVKTPSPI